jgi:hypothetical protein
MSRLWLVLLGAYIALEPIVALAFGGGSGR